jgi:hypothetical protein
MSEESWLEYLKKLEEEDPNYASYLKEYEKLAEDYLRKMRNIDKMYYRLKARVIQKHEKDLKMLQKKFFLYF